MFASASFLVSGGGRVHFHRRGSDHGDDDFVAADDAAPGGFGEGEMVRDGAVAKFQPFCKKAAAKRDVLVLHGHPDQWHDKRRAGFTKIIAFLQGESRRAGEVTGAFARS